MKRLTKIVAAWALLFAAFVVRGSESPLRGVESLRPLDVTGIEIALAGIHYPIALDDLLRIAGSGQRFELMFGTEHRVYFAIAGRDAAGGTYAIEVELESEPVRPKDNKAHVIDGRLCYISPFGITFYAPKLGKSAGRSRNSPGEPNE